jgi:ABC-type uncharacterized transport system substrate-binding protein
MLAKIFFLVAFLLAAMVQSSDAQPAGKIPRIGFLLNSAGSAQPQALVQGLRELNYFEGQNISFDYRTAGGKTERYDQLAVELIRLKVDLIVAEGSSLALAAKKATNTIPIVMTNSTNPIGTGLVASLARPGGNVTGMTSVTGELGGKLVDLLKEAMPKLSRVAILHPGGPSDELFVKETEAPSRGLGVQLVSLVARRPEEFGDAFRAMAKTRSQALLMRLPGNGFYAHFKSVAQLAAKNRLPSISPSTDWVEVGGLMTYGSDMNNRYRRAATYIDKILKGAKPADLPVEAPIKFELKINLKTAKQIGLTIPPNMLARADRVIR